MRYPFIVLLLALAPLDALFAQNQVLLEPGTRVRVTVPEMGLRGYVAAVEGVTADSLVLSTGGALQKYPLAAVTRLDVSRGSRRNWGRGAAIGAASFGAIGVVLGVAYTVSCRNSPSIGCFDTPEMGIPLMGGLLAGAGALVGAVVGGSSRSERWEEVPLDRLRVSVVPQRGGGFGVMVSLRL